MYSSTMDRSGSTWTTVALCAATAAAVWLCTKHHLEQEEEKAKKETNQKNKSLSNASVGGTTTTTKQTLDTDVSHPPPVTQVNIQDASDNAAAVAEDKDGLFRILRRNSVTIVHGSVTGTCLKMAKNLQQWSREQFPNRSIQMGSTQEFDWWDELLNDENDNDDDDTNLTKAQAATVPVLLLLLPTYTDGTWTPPAMSLQDALNELETDWRIAKFPLKGKLQVGILGVGSSAYDDITSANPTMGRPARQAVRQLQKLGAKCIVRLQVGDSAVGNHAWETYMDWRDRVGNQMGKKVKSQKQVQIEKSVSLAQATTSTEMTATTKSTTKSTEGDCACQSNTDGDQQHESGCCQTKDADGGEHEAGCCQSTPEEEANTLNENLIYESDDESEGGEPEVIDLEDMGDAILASQKASAANGEPREMVTPSQAAALKKEGYKLIGTHSAVKLCRWTKHQLRGRGGCYKHTFYGITSYQCMEATPSLACANKCVFCWRHHKNPVGKEWKWKTDDPNFIVEQAVNTHVQMIKEARGIPGVRMDRWKEAHTVRHCALSLVGEPIMYPRIDELLADLHRRKISSFLVTNGQHPPAIESLRPITQLYVSVDAPTKESLIEIDRPLFQDAWERLRQSLTSLKAKGQRTVARLTVVKGWNSDEITGYAELIALGHVSLVEVKGVTFCGKSDASNLNMSNTPYHHEVVALTTQLKIELDKLREKQSSDEEPIPEYGLACEHKHSVSVLLARVDQFSEETPTGGRKWKTWIDYDKFHELAARHVEDPSFTFKVEDYAAETPSWALFGANEEGFDPTETRHRRKNKHPKYTKFDERGIPTHDDNNQPLSDAERARLSKQMQERMDQMDGVTSVVTEHRDGTKDIEDPSLMFRGLVVIKE